MIYSIVLRDLIEGKYMCDVKKYYEMYNEIKNLKPEETLQLVLEAENQHCIKYWIL